MAWFAKKLKSCPHDDDGICARCMVGDNDSGVVLFTPLDEDLVIQCVSKLPDYMNERMREFGPDIVLAGGFIRDTLLGVPPKDMDFFVGKSMAGTLAGHYSVYAESKQGSYTVRIIPESGRTSMFGILQFIHKYKFKGPEDLLEQFDYSIARAAIWYDHQDKAWQGTCWHSWLKDVASKRLVFLDHRVETEAILRLLHFTTRGYSIDVTSLSRVLASVVGSVPAGVDVDLDKLEADLTASFEKMAPKPTVESKPYKKPKKVDNDWGGS